MELPHLVRVGDSYLGLELFLHLRLDDWSIGVSHWALEHFWFGWGVRLFVLKVVKVYWSSTVLLDSCIAAVGVRGGRSCLSTSFDGPDDFAVEEQRDVALKSRRLYGSLDRIHWLGPSDIVVSEWAELDLPILLERHDHIADTRHLIGHLQLFLLPLHQD